MRRTLEFWLLVLSVFVVTLPGSVAFANWDAPYGFYKDLSAWLGSAAGGLLPVLAWGLWKWRQRELGTPTVGLALAVFLTTTVVGYLAELALGGKMGYGSGNILLFAAGGVVGFVLSVMLFAVSIPSILAGGWYYSYDRPLVIAWLVMIALTLLVGVLVLKERRREKLTAPEGQGPSESSSGPGEP